MVFIWSIQISQIIRGARKLGGDCEYNAALSRFRVVEDATWVEVTFLLNSNMQQNKIRCVWSMADVWARGQLKKFSTNTVPVRFNWWQLEFWAEEAYFNYGP